MSSMNPSSSQRLTLDLVITKFEREKKTYQRLLLDATMVNIEFVAMPFGLTDAPATFQACMNNIFHKQLCKFVLVFFDDILIYSKTWEEHLHHLEEVLKFLHDQSFFSKM